MKIRLFVVMHAIDRILELTQLVQQRVDDGDWAEAGALDLERRQLLNGLLAENDITMLPSSTQTLLRDILAQNNRIISAVKTHKEEIASASGRLNRAPGAVRAYRRNTAPSPWSGNAELAE